MDGSTSGKEFSIWLIWKTVYRPNLLNKEGLCYCVDQIWEVCQLLSWPNWKIFYAVLAQSKVFKLLSCSQSILLLLPCWYKKGVCMLYIWLKLDKSLVIGWLNIAVVPDAVFGKMRDVFSLFRFKILLLVTESKTEKRKITRNLSKNENAGIKTAWRFCNKL